MWQGRVSFVVGRKFGELPGQHHISRPGIVFCFRHRKVGSKKNRAKTNHFVSLPDFEPLD
jgi:hypothetical protein